MELRTEQWDSDYRAPGLRSLEVILQQRMTEFVKRDLEEMARLAETDLGNGFFSRHLLTELGEIEVHIPFIRRFSAFSMLLAYALRAGQIIS